MKKLILPLLILAMLSYEKETMSCYEFTKTKDVVFIHNGDTIPHLPYCNEIDTICNLYPNEVKTYCKIFTGRDTLRYNEKVFINGCFYNDVLAYVNYTCTVRPL